MNDAGIFTKIAQERIKGDKSRIDALFDDAFDPIQRGIVITKSRMDIHKMERERIFVRFRERTCLPTFSLPSCDRGPKSEEVGMNLLGVLAIAVAASLMAIQASIADQRPISTDGSDPKTWDPKTDGPVAAPENHKVIFENENIRIMSVTVLPGAKEPYHSHLRCSVLVYDDPAQSRDYDGKGNLSPRVSLAAIPWLGAEAPNRPPLVFVQPPQALHSIVNNDTHALHLTRIELKKGCEAPPK